jgi:hypothetical protein
LFACPTVSNSSMKLPFLFCKKHIHQIYLNAIESREQDCSLIIMLIGSTYRYFDDEPLVGSSSGFVYHIPHSQPVHEELGVASRRFASRGYGNM